MDCNIKKLELRKQSAPTEVIDALEKALDAAKSGQLDYIIALVGVAYDKDSTSSTPIYFTVENDMYRALGLCGVLEHQIRRLTCNTCCESQL